MLRKLGTATVAAAALVALAGCAGNSGTGTSVAGGSDFQSGNHTYRYVAADKRKPAREVSGTTLSGAKLNLASYRGKYVVVNFWSAPCIPCSTEAPGFEALAKQDASKGVQFVGIDERDNRAAAQAFEAQYGITYPSLFDSSDAYILDFPGAVPSTTPYTLVLDPQGRVVETETDSMDFTTLRTFVNLALNPST